MLTVMRRVKGQGLATVLRNGRWACVEPGYVGSTPPSAPFLARCAERASCGRECFADQRESGMVREMQAVPTLPQPWFQRRTSWCRLKCGLRV